MLTYIGDNDVKYVYDAKDTIVHIAIPTYADDDARTIMTITLPIKDIQKIGQLCQVLDSN